MFLKIVCKVKNNGSIYGSNHNSTNGESRRVPKFMIEFSVSVVNIVYLTYYYY